MSQSIEAFLTDSETFEVQMLDLAAWDLVRPVSLKHYWSGHEAPSERHAEVRALWTAKEVLVRFDCQQHEPVVINDAPQPVTKTIGLWERDVCEIFIAPNANEPNRYFEFEAAPTGEWLDLEINQIPDKRETNWDYTSGMTVASLVGDKKVTICMSIPFVAMGHVPKTGDRWRANLFRCVGAGDDRGYLAWQPTHTERPNFHVPEVFGSLCFVS